MAQEQQNIQFVIKAIDQATGVFQQVERGLGGVQAGYASLTRLFAGGTAITAAVLAIKHIASATIDAERASNRLNAALRATAYASGITRAEIDQMAESLKGSTPFDDDEIRKGLSALLRFRDVQGDVFREAARLAPDLAAALDTDLVQAYTRLGRALEDPEKGLRALREAGINVTSVQDQVKRVMAETGDVAAAQKIILDELTKSIGGTAGAENAGLYGSAKATEKALGDLTKSIGNLFNSLRSPEPEVRRRLETLSGWLQAITPGGGRGAGPSREQLDNAARGASRQQSARLIVGHEEWVSKEVERIKKENADRDKRLREEDIKGWVALAEAKLQAASAELTALASGESFTQWAERYREKVLGNIEPMRAWKKELEDLRLLFVTGNLSLEQFNRAATDPELRDALEPRRTIYDKLNEALKEGDISLEAYNEAVKRLRGTLEETNDVARSLGFTFASAFEDAIVEGKKLRDVLQGIAQDILRILVRRTITEPAANWFSTLFSGLFSGAAGGEMHPTQHGGRRGAGEHLLVGEAGPELWVPDTAGMMVPNNRLGGVGGVTIVQNISFSANTPAAVRDAVFAAAPRLVDMAKAAVFDAQMRGSRP